MGGSLGMQYRDTTRRLQSVDTARGLEERREVGAKEQTGLPAAVGMQVHLEGHQGQPLRGMLLDWPLRMPRLGLH